MAGAGWTAVGTAAIGGIKKALEGGTGKEITQATIAGAGVPSFGGRRDKYVGQAYDAVKGRLQEFHEARNAQNNG